LYALLSGVRPFSFYHYIGTANRCGDVAVKTECSDPTITTTKSKMNTTTEMNASIEIAPVVAEQKAPVRRRIIQTKKPVVEAPPPKAPTPPASEDEAESSASESEAESSADEAPPVEAPKKSPTIPVAPAEWKRLKEIEKLYNEMKPKYEAFAKKDLEKKAKANEASKRSKAKKSKETKEVKAKLEERVEKLEKLVIKSAPAEKEESDAEESDAEAEDEE